MGPAIAIISTQPGDPRHGKLAAPRRSIPGLETFPARVRDRLLILCTGLGEVDVPVENGHNSLDHLRRTKTTPTVLIGGVPVLVEFSGLDPNFVGVNQINVLIDHEVPKGNAIPLQLQVGGITTTGQVTIAVE
jgi:uncharacterized protein (TIGR03437 family)